MSSTVLEQNSLLVRRHIGEKLKQRRTALKLRQADLAKLLRVSPQQIFKYEKGQDWVSTEKLLELSTILSVSPSFFYPKLEGFGAPHRGVIVVCKNKEGKGISLRLIDEDHIFSEIKVIEQKL